MLSLQSLSSVQVVEELCVRTWWLFLLLPRVVLISSLVPTFFKKEKVSLAGRDEYIVRGGGICFHCCPSLSRGSKRSVSLAGALKDLHKHKIFVIPWQQVNCVSLRLDQGEALSHWRRHGQWVLLRRLGRLEKSWKL